MAGAKNIPQYFSFLGVSHQLSVNSTVLCSIIESPMADENVTNAVALGIFESVKQKISNVNFGAIRSIKFRVRGSGNFVLM